MSIRGIDTQIMITRSPDYVRDASAMQRKPEVSQEHLAAQQKTNAMQEQKMVIKTNESEMETIRTDVDGGSGGAQGGGGGGSGAEDENKEGEGHGFLVPPGDHKIDITI